ncbi:ABC transporter permease [Fodinibius saliphilus]|uniref:ABC transporter permease n=1 Tax=Fodinibius saliphilus TaxID=1920650 RepID=UPI0011087C21|nr:ABC transporter permease [Fodinibius saliphilus]
MLSKCWISFKIACQNIKSNLLHTFLSTLGIVIGVAALVTILSLIDGMENYARSQITQTTSLQTIIVESRHRLQVDGVWVDNKNAPVLMPQNVERLKRKLNNVSSVELRTSGSATIFALADTAKTATYFYALSSDSLNTEKIKMKAGSNIFDGHNSAIISETLAKVLSSEDGWKSTVGRKFEMHGNTYTVSGIFNRDREAKRRIVVPFLSLSDEVIRNNAPKLIIDSEKVEAVEKIKSEVENWLAANYENAEQNFHIFTNQMRVEQARKGMLLFKLIMGLITGIAVVVGGIGVMNVLLISVTERTAEIGIRKATGAKKFDIILQFLSESVTVSIFGSFLGLILGMLVAMAAVPIVKLFIEVPFEAGFSVSTMGIIAILAVVIGIIFGTYPAIRAAKLTPVEAIRRE